MPHLRRSVKRKRSEKNCVLTNDMATFVISCEHHNHRRQKFKRFASKAGIRYCIEPCVNGKKFTPPTLRRFVRSDKLSPRADITPIEVAITMSHINCWRRLVNSSHEYALVFEDDVEVKVRFKTYLQRIMTALENRPPDLLYLWNGNWGKTRSALRSVVRIEPNLWIRRETERHVAGGVAYVIHRKYAAKLLERAFPIKHPADYLLGHYISPRRYRIYTVDCEYDSFKECYTSPLFRKGVWICGGEHGTGTGTTQEHHAPVVKELI